MRKKGKKVRGNRGMHRRMGRKERKKEEKCKKRVEAGRWRNRREQ